jgi:hypothetical protein
MNGCYLGIDIDSMDGGGINHHDLLGVIGTEMGADTMVLGSYEFSMMLTN